VSCVGAGTQALSGRIKADKKGLTRVTVTLKGAGAAWPPRSPTGAGTMPFRALRTGTTRSSRRGSGPAPSSRAAAQ
jgi:hypothetical protein